MTGEMCASAEGLHARALVRRRVVSDVYFGLGYALQQPTCATARE